jgi:hypothetical protein
MARPMNRLATELPIRLMALPIQAMIKAAIKMRLLLCPISGKNDDLLFALISHRK